MKFKVLGLKFVLGCVMVLFFMGCGESIDFIQVVVIGGVVQGVKNNNVIVFKGILFVVLLVGDLCWWVFQVVQFWEGVMDVNDYGNDCMQLLFFSDVVLLGKIFVEDCFYVNVWKFVDVNENMLVLVWFYGGGYVNGGVLLVVYNGEYFVESGVIFVSFNYCLGCFGFFVYFVFIEEVKVNNELMVNFVVMDQVIVLYWVKNNIVVFGGDLL